MFYVKTFPWLRSDLVWIQKKHLLELGRVLTQRTVPGSVTRNRSAEYPYVSSIKGVFTLVVLLGQNQWMSFYLIAFSL